MCVQLGGSFIHHDIHNALMALIADNTEYKSLQMYVPKQVSMYCDLLQIMNKIRLVAILK